MFKKLVNDNNSYSEPINKSLEIVLQFITDNKLVLKGGIAIDLALKLKGDKLYEDDIPDYDIYSPDFYQNAFDVAKLIHEKVKPAHLSVIPAAHAQTISVRVYFTAVADFTYCPREKYSELKTLNRDGLYFLHPHEQMIDQMIVLSYPLWNVPKENIGRWKKDGERFNMLYKYYPFEYPGESKRGFSDKLTLVKSIPPESQCVTGYHAYQYWLKKAQEGDYTGNIMETGGVTAVYVDDLKLIQEAGLMRGDWFSHGLGKLPIYTVSAGGVDGSAGESDGSAGESDAVKGESDAVKGESDAVKGESDTKKQPPPDGTRVYHLRTKVNAVKSPGGYYVAKLQAVLLYYLVLDPPKAYYVMELIKWAVENKRADFLPCTSLFGKYNYTDNYIDSKANLMMMLRGKAGVADPKLVMEPRPKQIHFSEGKVPSELNMNFLDGESYLLYRDTYIPNNKIEYYFHKYTKVVNGK